MNNERQIGRVTIGKALAIFVALCFAFIASEGQSEANKYIGAKKCKKCHSSAAHGNQYKAWSKMKHASAYTMLGEAKAKEVGAKLGAPDPQKSEKCLKCHDTGRGEPASAFASSFKPLLGVQCESCHGQGETHAKARSAAAKAGDVIGPVPKGEIAMPTEKTCKGCHNKKSPSFKAFDYKERCLKIAHPDPSKNKKPCSK